MKSKYFLGYIFAIVCGLMVIGSAFLSLNITYIAKTHTQEAALFNVVMNFASADLNTKIVAILYLAAILFSLVLIVYSMIMFIATLRGKTLKVNLLVIRILSCIAFSMTIAMFVYLGVVLSLRSTPYYNFIGIGPALAVIGSLLMVLSLFMVKKRIRNS